MSLQVILAPSRQVTISLQVLLRNREARLCCALFKFLMLIIHERNKWLSYIPEFGGSWSGSNRWPRQAGRGEGKPSAAELWGAKTGTLRELKSFQWVEPTCGM